MKRSHFIIEIRILFHIALIFLLSWHEEAHGSHNIWINFAFGNTIKDKPEIINSPRVSELKEKIRKTVKDCYSKLTSLYPKIKNLIPDSSYWFVLEDFSYENNKEYYQEHMHKFEEYPDRIRSALAWEMGWDGCKHGYGAGLFTISYSPIKIPEIYGSQKWKVYCVDISEQFDPTAYASVVAERLALGTEPIGWTDDNSPFAGCYLGFADVVTKYFKTKLVENLETVELEYEPDRIYIVGLYNKIIMFSFFVSLFGEKKFINVYLSDNKKTLEKAFDKLFGKGTYKKLCQYRDEEIDKMCEGRVYPPTGAEAKYKFLSKLLQEHPNGPEIKKKIKESTKKYLKYILDDRFFR